MAWRAGWFSMSRQTTTKIEYMLSISTNHRTASLAIVWRLIDHCFCANMSRLAPFLFGPRRRRRCLFLFDSRGAAKGRTAAVRWRAMGLVRGGGGGRCDLWRARGSTRCDGLGFAAAGKTYSGCCAKEGQKKQQSAFARRVIVDTTCFV